MKAAKHAATTSKMIVKREKRPFNESGGENKIEKNEKGQKRG